MIKPTTLLLFLSIYLITGTTDARVYVYELPNGSKLITDKKYYKKGYKLKRTYGIGSNRSTKSARENTTKSQFDALIVSTAFKYNLEPSFIKAIIHVESSFDRYALSKAGAMGLMQLMPATAANYQLNQDHFNPQRNIEAGVQHMKELMMRYNNDKTLSLAAYNAGESAVNQYRGVPPYDETQDYIKKVINLYDMYKLEI